MTGEGPHHTFSLAEELGVNLIYGGHYATETFGVRALAERVASQFALPWIFLGSPVGTVTRAFGVQRSATWLPEAGPERCHSAEPLNAANGERQTPMSPKSTEHSLRPIR